MAITVSRRAHLAGVAALATALGAAPSVETVRAQACTAEQLADAVDQAGANLRRITQELQPRLDQRLRQLKAKRGWADGDYEEKGYAEIADARSEALERQANELLARIDTLGALPAGATPECGRLQELSAASLELQATVRTKGQYAIGRLDAALGVAPASPAASVKPAEAKPDPKPAEKQAAVAPPPVVPKAAAPPATQPPPAAPAAQARSAPAAQAPSAPAPGPQAPWSTTTTASAEQPAGASPPSPGAEDAFTVDDIVRASSGFFGNVSAGLGSVVEHAFSRIGRPTAYILGEERGGAFLAGLRYGRGTLYMRSGETRPIFWHGPSLGTDIGASGAKVMFLIYRMRNPDELVDSFTGIEGSAYLVGGLGLTLMTNGHVQAAPIRSGVGLRFGASIGYVRFTRRATWNPF
jgi:hypothetical protein